MTLELNTLQSKGRGVVKKNSTKKSKLDPPENLSSFKQSVHNSAISTKVLCYDWLKYLRFSGEPIFDLDLLFEFCFIIEIIKLVDADVMLAIKHLLQLILRAIRPLMGVKLVKFVINHRNLNCLQDY